MSATINAIIDAVSSGYSIRIDRFGGHVRVRCTKERDTNPVVPYYDTVVPYDHVTDFKLAEIIDFNTEQIKKNIKKKEK